LDEAQFKHAGNPQRYRAAGQKCKKSDKRQGNQGGVF
jgi:hypothetical protein